MTEIEKITEWKIAKEFIKNNKTLFTLHTLCLLNIPLKEILIPALVGILYNLIRKGVKKNIILLTFIIFIISCIVQSIDVFADYLDAKLFPIMQKETRLLILEHLFKINENNFSEISGGLILTHIVRFPWNLYEYMSSWLNSFAPSIIKIIFLVIYFLLIKWQLAVLITIVLVYYVILCHKSFGKCTQVSVDRDAKVNVIYGNVEDTLTNLKTVFTFNNTLHEVNRIAEPEKVYMETTVKTKMCTVTPKVFLILSLFIFSLIVILGNLNILPIWNLNDMSKGTVIGILIIVYTTYFSGLQQIRALKDVIFNYGPIQSTLKILNDYKLQHEVDTTPYVSEESDPETGIYLNNVSFKYNEKSPIVLDNVTMHIPKNRTTLIIGKIGSGKSTLINLILKYNVPNKGHILIDSDSYSTISNEFIRNKISHVNQHPIFFNRSIYDNIVYGINGITREYVEGMIDNMGLTEFFDTTFSEGIDSNVGMRGSKLSGGQKQLISLIKMMILRPEYLLLDEPTSAMDVKTIDHAIKLIKELSQYSTIIIVTHDLSLHELADNIFFVKNGTVSKMPSKTT